MGWDVRSINLKVKSEFQSFAKYGLAEALCRACLVVSCQKIIFMLFNDGDWLLCSWRVCTKSAKQVRQATVSHVHDLSSEFGIKVCFLPSRISETVKINGPVQDQSSRSACFGKLRSYGDDCLLYLPACSRASHAAQSHCRQALLTSWTLVELISGQICFLVTSSGK